MNDLRTAAQQALEAMDKATRFMSDADYRKLNEAITALRAALAQQAEPVQRKPLTEEEIERICMTYQSPRQAARAIERAHGIGEQDAQV